MFSRKNSLLSPLMLLAALVVATFQVQSKEPVAVTPAAKPPMEVVIVHGRLRTRAEALADDDFDKTSVTDRRTDDNRRRRGDAIAVARIVAGSS